MADDVRARLAELEGLDEDLFDFPDVQGTADLLAASREAAADSRSDAPRPAASKPQAPAAEAAAPTPARPAEPKPTPTPARAAAEPRPPLPSAPIAASDLDEDLFGFGDLLDLGSNAGLGTEDPLLDPDPLADLAAEPWAAAGTPPQTAAKEPAVAAAPEPPAAQAAKGPAAGSAPKQAPKQAPAPAPAEEPQAGEEASGGRERKPKGKKSAAKPTVVMREKKAPEPAASSAPNQDSRESRAKATPHQAGALLAFPDGIDLPPARSKLLWVLVGCFLLVNGMIFLITQQQSQSVNQTLAAVTSTLADAIARGSQAPAPVPAGPRAYEGVSEPTYERPTPLDPATYSNTHEVALESARRLIQVGEYTRARRNLFTILANQDRGTPLTQAVREEIDYLIALTYYDQGLSIAPEASR